MGWLAAWKNQPIHLIGVLTGSVYDFINMMINRIIGKPCPKDLVAWRSFGLNRPGNILLAQECVRQTGKYPKVSD